MTCNAAQDSDKDVTDEDRKELVPFDCFHSASACCADGVAEVFKIFGKLNIK